MDERIKKIIDFNKSPSLNIKAENEIKKLLSDPYSRNIKMEKDAKTAITILEKKKAKTNENVYKFLVGALNFFLFSIAAEDSNDKKYAKANRILENLETSSFIINEYDIPCEYITAKLTLHKVGTTSFILKSSRLAIKIIKYRYVNNSSIAADTANYMSKMMEVDGSHTPNIYKSSEKYIIMDFIKGITLHDFLKNEMEELNKVNINIMIRVFKELCGILKIYAEQGLHHLDLSSDNIILSKEIDGGEKWKVWLIDFGYNYILGERIGSSLAFINAQVYIAPELFEGKASYTNGYLSKSDENKALILSDIYSLGIILIEMFYCKRVYASDLMERLDGIRLKLPMLSNLLESMLDDPKFRMFEKKINSSIYENISQIAEEALTIFATVNLKKKSFADILINIISFSLIDVIKARLQEIAYLQNRDTKADKAKANSIKRLMAFSAVTQILNATTIYLFFFKYLQTDFSNNDWGKLCGRIVALSFSLVAARYYTQIFIFLDARGLSKKTEFWMRFNSFCFSIPILYAMVIDPSAWPFCSSLGVFFVAANNKSSADLVKIGKEKILDQYKKENVRKIIPTSLSEFWFEFSVWWEVMTVYGIMLLIVGILLKLNIIFDEYVYALIVATAINGKMYRYNCTNLAPKIRAGLAWVFYMYRKSKKFQELKNNPQCENNTDTIET